MYECAIMKNHTSQHKGGVHVVQYMEFTDDLVTGNTLIDGQHKELIGKINDLLRTCETGDGKKKALNTLDYLEEYTNFHFSQEEALQEEIGYPGLKEHQAKHKEFVQSIKELYEMLEEQEGPTDAFVQQVNKNVVDWFVNHIRGFDRAVAEFKNQKNS